MFDNDESSNAKKTANLFIQEKANDG